MTFYKVKPEADQTRVYVAHKYSGFLIGNELFTEKELSRKNWTWLIDRNVFDVVNVSKRKTYWSFGARFAVKGVIK